MFAYETKVRYNRQRHRKMTTTEFIIRPALPGYESG